MSVQAVPPPPFPPSSFPPPLDPAADARAHRAKLDALELSVETRVRLHALETARTRDALLLDRLRTERARADVERAGAALPPAARGSGRAEAAGKIGEIDAWLDRPR